MALVLCAPLLGGSAWLMQNDSVVGKGQKAFASEKFEQAAMHFRAAMKGDASQAVVQFNLGTALAEQGRRATEPEEATRLLRLAMVALRSALDTDEAELRRNAHFNLGNTLVWASEYELAIEHYRVVLREDPKDDEARYNLELAQLLRDSEVSLADVTAKSGQDDGQADHASTDNVAGDPKHGRPSEGQGEGSESSEAGQGEGSEGETSGETDSGDGKAQAMRAEPRPMRETESSQGRGVQEKLDALERRSGELRRGRVLRRTKSMRRSRNEDGP